MTTPDLLLHVEAYVGLRKALGYAVRSDEKLLKEFVTFLEFRQIHGPIRAQLAIDWACLPAPGRGPSGQASRLKIVRGFLSHLRATWPETEVPGPGSLAPIRRPSPYLYTTREIAALLQAAAELGPRNSLRPYTYVTVIGLLASTGVRIGEALRTFAPQPGSRWQGHGTAFVSRPCRLDCTLLACWEEGYKDAWFILTDLPPESSEACWYGLRAWIEQGFKITKRGGWQWRRTRMTDPERAARLWLAVAVATLWLLSVGGTAEETIPPSTFLDLTAALGQERRQRRAARLRLVSIFRQGWNLFLVALLQGQRLPVGRFVSEPWPSAEYRDLNLPVIHEVLLAA